MVAGFGSVMTKVTSTQLVKPPYLLKVRSSQRGSNNNEQLLFIQVVKSCDMRLQ